MRKSQVIRSILIAVSVVFISTIGNSQVTLDAIEDSYIYQGGVKADNIYGILDSTILISRKSVASAEYTREAYCMFEIGTQAESFSMASLQLFGDVVESKNVEVYYTDTTWDEETLTGRNRPLGTYISTSFLEAGEDTFSWDVTHYVNAAKSAGANKISFVLKDIAGAVSSKDTKWHSKENASGKGPNLILTPGEAPEIYTGNYYIDQVNGDDSNSGQSPDKAWKTLVNIGSLILDAGDSLLFKSGGEWTGTFSPKGSGIPGKPIVIGKYGDGERPVINGSGLATNTITLNNQHHIELRDLAVSNKGDVAAFRRAIFIQASDIGEVCHIVLDNLEVFDVNGDMEDKNNGGIFLEITGSTVPTWFDTLVVSNCYIHDVNRTGMSNVSEWDNRTLTVNENWTPSKNIHIHHNTFERTGANGLIVRAAHKPIMEYNLFTHCAIIGSGNASFSFNTDSAIWQYNEACYTKFNDGDHDAGGFDSDFRAKHTIIQYNYSHDNEFSGILLTGGNTATAFNEGTIIRYNVFANNKDHIIRVSGRATNSKIYNNVFYTGPELQNVRQVYHKKWGYYSDGTTYWNNIFYNEGTNSTFRLEESTNNVFSNNVYYGNPFLYRPYDPGMVTEDPKLFNPGAAGDGFDAVNEFRIIWGSSAIDKGLEIDGTTAVDLAGNPVPLNAATDIGAFEYTGPAGIESEELISFGDVSLYPNPLQDNAWLQIDSRQYGNVEVSIYNSRMSLYKVQSEY